MTMISANRATWLILGVSLGMVAEAESAPGKRIAFVDAKLDNYHANIFLDAMRGDLKSRGWDVTACHALDEAGGKVWAGAKGVRYLADPKQLGKAADAFMILAPSNPEVHLELVKKVVGFGKPVWVDKTFAPDLATAREIFRLADERKVPVETASALRYTAVQAAAKEFGNANLRHVVCWSPGRSVGEYLVHPAELAVSVLGPDALRAMARPDEGEGLVVTVEFSRSRTATLHLMLGSNQPYAATLATGKDVRHVMADGNVLFRDACAGILDFFDAKAPTFDRAETLAIMKILDAVRDPASRTGFVSLGE